MCCNVVLKISETLLQALSVRKKQPAGFFCWLRLLPCGGQTQIGFFLGDFELYASLKHIINDGLMVMFFFLFGLEIKREVIAGDLAGPPHRCMLILCALRGVVCPTAIYLLLNWSLETQAGWDILIATDAAFAFSVLSELAPIFGPSAVRKFRCFASREACLP
jgi:Na+/H+ antiporter NhaA